MTDLTIGGETFRVEVEGDAERPSVLLSNSLGTDLSLWNGQMPALLEHFRVVRYDPRGHGRSTAAGAPYSLARLGADALAILDALEIETTHFIGISMGGAVGQWLLVNAPARIDRAVLANTVARFGTPHLWNERIAVVLSEGMETLAPSTMERWFGTAFRETSPDRIATIEAVFRATPPVGYAGCCAALRDMDLRHAIHVVTNPVLILSGREDPVTSAAEIDMMTDAIRGAQHVALNCRHISNVEDEAAFNAAVITFLTAQAPTRVARRPAHRHVAAVRRPARARAAAARSPLKPTAKPSLGKPAGGVLKAGSAGRRTAEQPTALERTTGRRGSGAPGGKPRARKPAVARVAARRAGAGRKPAAKVAEKAAAKAARAALGKAAPARKASSTKTAAASKTAVGSKRMVAPKKAAAKKASATKVPAKTVLAKKVPAKKASATKASAKKASATKASAKKATVPKSPTARRRPAKKRGRPGGRPR